MKNTFITTVLNEEETIVKFLDSLNNQSKLPDEIIIVDGGSTDNTLSIISNFQFPISKNKVKIIQKMGNRSVGRNEAIKLATGDVILCSDGGCVLDKNWVKNISEPFKYRSVDVVAGYYRALTFSIFQECLVPYVLVMPDKTKEKEFLPASRSMAFRKKIWEKAGRFPENFSYNEDYVFAKQLKKIGAKIVFQKNAIVSWIPRSSLKDSFSMFYRFAYGDVMAKIFRMKVLLIFVRYIIGLLLFILFLMTKSPIILNSLFMILFLYVIWAIAKNYKYVKNVEAFLYLPLLQLVSDIAVILGSLFGLYKNIWDTKYMR